MAVRASDRELDKLGLSVSTLGIRSRAKVTMSSLQCHGVCKSHVSLEMMLHSFAPIPGFAHSHAVKLSEPVLARIEELKEKTSNVKQPGLRVLLYNLFFMVL
jgi:hypothetical protein